MPLINQCRTDCRQHHQQIDIDLTLPAGKVSVLLGPNGATFDAAQAKRTATYRLDLLVSNGAEDVDGNGLPISYNTLIGNAFVSAGANVGNYGAEALAAWKSLSQQIKSQYEENARKSYEAYKAQIRLFTANFKLN